MEAARSRNLNKSLSVVDSLPLIGALGSIDVEAGDGAAGCGGSAGGGRGAAAGAGGAGAGGSGAGEPEPLEEEELAGETVAVESPCGRSGLTGISTKAVGHQWPDRTRH